MKKIFLSRWSLIIIVVVVAFVLRFYKLDSYPALNADEASIGYDAYSLLQTGKDQHGNSWPINFQSFNDFKPGLYVYLTLPFIFVLGLTEWAVRIPNALLGVASVVVVYFLVLELFKSKENKVVERKHIVLASVSSLMLAVSPWHIHFSRGGWEANSATFFISLGVLLFVKYFNSASKKALYLAVSVLFFVFSIYCYQATRVIAPLLVFGLVFIYRREVFVRLKPFLMCAVFGLVLIVPLLFDFTKGSALSRAAGVGLFADPGPRSRIEEQRGEHGNVEDILGKALHNKIVNYGFAFLQNWGKHFHGEFLFLSGDEVQRSKVPETGQMYIIDVVFVGLGVIFIVKSRITKEKQILLMWVIVAPIASALTFQSPSALRAHSMVVPLVIIAAIGFLELIAIVREKIKYKNLVYGLTFVLAGVMVWGVARYLQMYYVHMAKEYPYSSQYGVKELVHFIGENGDRFKKVLVTDRYDQPYILFLFYMKYPPAKFQAEHTLTGKDGFGFSTVNNFDKYYFASIKYDQARVENPNTLIVGTNEEIPKEANIIKDVYGSNNYLYFRVVAN